MCGRFTVAYSADEITQYLQDAFAIDGLELPDIPRFNVAPSMDVVAVLYDGTHFRGGPIKWGFTFNKGGKTIQAFNTRIESIQSKPFFNQLYRTQRLALLSTGYFEWDTHTKHPYWIHYEDQSPMFLGGIWRKDATFESSIITLEAPDDLAKIHPRVPFSMPLSRVKTWLREPTQSAAALYQKPSQITPITSAVNRPENNDASILKSL